MSDGNYKHLAEGGLVTRARLLRNNEKPNGKTIRSHCKTPPPTPNLLKSPFGALHDTKHPILRLLSNEILTLVIIGSGLKQ